MSECPHSRPPSGRAPRCPAVLAVTAAPGLPKPDVPTSFSSSAQPVRMNNEVAKVGEIGP